MTLLETLLSAALTMMLGGTIMSLVVAGQTMARTQPEALDLQQRARIALQTIGGELRDAGAGLDRGPLAGPLVRYFPPIAPSADGGLTIWRATSHYAQGRPAIQVALGATLVALQDSDVCPQGQGACAFAAGDSAIAFGASGCRTVMRVATAAADTLQLDAPLAGCALDPGFVVAAGSVRTYRVDPVARQLVRRDESTGSSAPVLDGVTSMTVTCFADGEGTDVVTGSTDADLMRVRRVRLTLRLVASSPLLHVPDLDVAIDVVPRNGGGL